MANQPSAASSACAPSGFARYDVFINHRGPDVKNTFAAHLYRRLLDHGLQVFLDKPELQPGHQITPQIQYAIEVASVHIAIFSPTYAESKWCLDELVLMVESRAIILPVFYRIKPSDLRWTMNDGAYSRALRKLEQKNTFDSESGKEKPRYDSDTIRNWKSALSHTAEISGFELDGDEEELLSKVVQSVLKNVSKPPLYVAKYPTGLEEKLQEFETTVLKEQEGRMRAKVVGIVGYGGVGKTTLAKEFFNRKRSDYNESSFLLDVRETSARMSLHYLQTKLLEDLKPTSKIKIDSPDQGVGILNRYLSSCHALVVLDDVDNVYQLEMLLPMKDILNPQSLILVTSRDKHVLRSSGVLESSIYNLTGLNTPHSKELFCSYAFFKRFPPSDFEELVDQFVIACNGLPLSLKVMGALVCGQNEKPYWEEQFDRLRETVPEEIQKRLKISYDSLSIEDKPIFLDIACFFLGENRDKATRIWGFVGFRNLEDKCLLEVDNENKIRMHDHIRDCARSIAEEESMPGRFYARSIAGEESMPRMLHDLLEKSSAVGTEVRAIATRISPPLSFFFTRMELEMLHLFNNPDFRGIKKLRIVATVDHLVKAILSRLQSPHLIWLCWYGCSLSSLPDWIPMKNLRVLEVSGNHLKSLWPHQSEAPVQLRELSIFTSLSELPKSIGQLKHLEWIHIGACEVTTLPEEFCGLTSLKYLMLIGFSRLKSLPDSFGKLTNLHHINLERACSLKMLPNSFGDLTRLKNLRLRNCPNLTISNETLGNITTLEFLNLEMCSNVKELPPQVARQRCLKELYLENTSLKELPSGIGDLCNLEVLKIGNNSLEVLPPSLVCLKNLKVFSVYFSPKLNCVLDSLALLTQLRELSLFACGIEYLPQDLPKINNLESLEVRTCPLRELPLLLKEGRAWNKLDSADGNCMFGLKRLQIDDAKISEVAFPEGVCPNLQSLEIECCKELTQIGGLCGLAKLNNLRVLDCVELEELPSLETLRYLENICVKGCRKLKSIAGLEQVTQLRRLNVSGCHEIAGLPSVEHCTSLEELDVSGCHKLKSIAGLGQLTKLWELHVSGCHEIAGLPGVEHCTSLNFLNASDCPKLQWGGGVLQQLRQRLGIYLTIDIKQYRRRKFHKRKRIK